MNRHPGLFAIVVLLATSGVAQTSPCSGGSINPLFTVIAGSPMHLKFEHTTTHTLLAPSVKVAGHSITVSQMPLDVPPPPLAPGGLALNCNAQTVSLGVLAPGAYDVAWNYGFASGGVPGSGPVVIESHPFSFAVADAPTPCTAPLSTPRIALRRTDSGAWRLHYDHSFLGYVPRFSAPSVSMAGNSVIVMQPVADNVPPIGDGQYPPPPTRFCDGEDVDLPALGAGTYGISILYVLTTPDLPPAQYAGGSAGFIIGPSLDVQCTSTRTFSTVPALPVAGATVTLSSTVLVAGGHSGPNVVRQGNTFILTDRKDDASSAPYCFGSAAIVGPLDTGVYSVQWRLVDLGVPVPDSESSFSFRVVAGLRRHAAH